MMDIDTLILHGGYLPDGAAGSTVTPIHQTAAYAHTTAEGLSNAFTGKGPGYVYSRIANPTSSALERRLAEMEGGIGCLSCSSGMAAIASVIMGLTHSGDHILAVNGIFGGTISFLTKTLSRFSVDTTFISTSDIDGFANSIRDNTKLIFIETITNPGMDVPDIHIVSKVARQAGIPLVVDSTVTTPILIRPGEWDADIVVHSLSKFINGHGNSIGGAVIDTGNFNWSNSPFDDIRQLSEKAGRIAFLAHLRKLIYRDLGCCPSPFNSFLHLTGIEGLALRMEAHCRNAMLLAEYLEAHPKVKWVNYPGLGSNPSHDLAARQFNGKFGGILTFSPGSIESAFSFINNLSRAQNTANIGDSKTLVIHPASTIFHEFSEDERKTMGVPDDLIRVSVGVENINDIIADFESALYRL